VKKRNKMLLIVMVCVAMALVVLPFLSGSAKAGPGEAVDLKIAHYQPPTGLLQNHVLVPWFKMINERSKVKVNPIYFPAASLCTAAQSLDAVQSGMTDIAWMYCGNLPGRLLLTNILELPLAPWEESALFSGFVSWRLFAEGYTAEEWKGVKVLALYGNPRSVIHLGLGETPVRKSADLKGMKIAAPTEMSAKALKALGASPVSVSIPDTYVSVQKRIIDGIVFPFSGLFSFKCNEVTKYHLMIPVIAGGTFAIVMNRAKWDALPRDVKEAMDELSGKWLSEFASQAFNTDDERRLEQLKQAADHEVVYFSSDELEKCRKAVEPVWDEWIASMEAKGLAGKRVFDAAFRISKEYEKPQVK
jgi:TRAP-type C4-dicarboxylate transport system substrate-binding protein